MHLLATDEAKRGVFPNANADSNLFFSDVPCISSWFHYITENTNIAYDISKQ